MKIFNIYLLVFLGLLGAQACAQKKILTAKITCIQPYCGGARPTPEMEADAATTKPFANQTVILISAKGKVDSLKTDAQGIIKKKLAVGVYKVFETWRYYKLAPHGERISNFDKNCLAKEWQKHFMEITLTKKTTTQKADGPIYLFCLQNSPCQLESHLIPQRE